jgi:hypothetical protein
MPGAIGAVTGFVDREIGKSIYAASSLQRVGKGAPWRHPAATS